MLTIQVLRSENLHLNSLSRACAGFSAPKLTLKQFINETWEAAQLLPRVALFYGEQHADSCQSCELLLEQNGVKHTADFTLEPLSNSTSFCEWVDFIKEEIEKELSVHEEYESPLFQAFKEIATYIGRQQ